MALDVMKNPSCVMTPLAWYDTRETTPFALCGHIGPVLAMLAIGRPGDAAREVWFGDDGWQYLDGMPLVADSVLWFAIPPKPFAATASRDQARLVRVVRAFGRVLAQAANHGETPGIQAQADGAELVMTLARLLEGRPLDKAFGAPGDWGYDTLIGAALAGRDLPLKGATP